MLRDLVAALESDAAIDSGVYSALAWLDRAETSGRMPLRMLHARMQVRYSQPGLSRLVRRMEADGLVERSRVSEDGRAFTVVLTRSGRTRFRRARDVYRAALHRHLGRHVTPAEATRLAATLEELAAKLTRAADR